MHLWAVLQLTDCHVMSPRPQQCTWARPYRPIYCVDFVTCAQKPHCWCIVYTCMYRSSAHMRTMAVQGLALSQGWQTMRTKSQHEVCSWGCYLTPSQIGVLNAAGVNERPFKCVVHAFLLAWDHARVSGSHTTDVMCSTDIRHNMIVVLV